MKRKASRRGRIERITGGPRGKTTGTTHAQARGRPLTSTGQAHATASRRRGVRPSLCARIKKELGSRSTADLPNLMANMHVPLSPPTSTASDEGPHVGKLKVQVSTCSARKVGPMSALTPETGRAFEGVVRSALQALTSTGLAPPDENTAKQLN